MLFSEFSLTPNLLKGIDEAGYSSCTTVQQETLLHTLEGKDVFVQSQTGTGKTAAFLISIFENLARSNGKDKAIIVSPTRELAVQISEEAKLLSLYLDYNITTIYGGVGYNGQMRAIAEGIDVLIGTPGRLIDMANRRMLNMHQFSCVVIDEADRMFDMGFVHDVQTILRKLPPRESRQTMLFSATLSTDVKRLAASSMNNPAEVHIAPENITVETIDQMVYHVGSSRKMSLLLGVLNKFGTGRALVFVNMKHMAEEITQRLKTNGIEAEYLTGDLAQSRRQRCIDRFKNNELPVLVATDVAARGIHVDDLELVVNYDIPMHSENYVHRIGRTARAGKSGHAITLACETFVEFLSPIEEFIRMKIPSGIAEDELYLPDASEGTSFRRSRKEGSRSNSRGTAGSSRGRGGQRDGSSRGNRSGSGGRSSRGGSYGSQGRASGGRGQSGSYRDERTHDNGDSQRNRPSGSRRYGRDNHAQPEQSQPQGRMDSVAGADTPQRERYSPNKSRRTRQDGRTNAPRSDETALRTNSADSQKGKVGRKSDGKGFFTKVFSIFGKKS